MIFDAPLPFREAIHYLAGKDLLPTDMDSAELRSLDKSIRERSLFSAKTFYEDYLAELRDKLLKIVNPERAFGGVPVGRASPRAEGTGPIIGLDYATARLQLRQMLDDLGYAPEADQLGKITDLASDARLNLVLRTNVETAQGYGFWRQGQDEAVLDLYPAQELFRAEDRDTPRGFRRGSKGLLPDPEHSWRARWNEAGEASGQEDGWGIFGARLIALKNHPIWDKLGDSELFDDGLDNPYPPFAFNSGMDVRDVERSEAVELGLITEDAQVQPQVRPFEIVASHNPIFANYDPGEPRDEQGRWTSEGATPEQRAAEGKRRQKMKSSAAADEMFSLGMRGEDYGIKRSPFRQALNHGGYTSHGRPTDAFWNAWSTDKEGMKQRGWWVQKEDGAFWVNHTIPISEVTDYQYMMGAHEK